MQTTQPWLGADQEGGFFQNSSDFVINGGVFTNGGSSAKSTGIADHEQLQSESEVYARMLLLKKKGYPLWNPNVSDDLPPEYRKRGVSIGDVGTIDEEGRFEYFFNILLPADHPSNMAGGVPAGFIPLSVGPGKKERSYPPGTHIAHPWSDIHKRQLGRHEVELSRELEDALGTRKIPPEVRYGFQIEANSSEGAILFLPEGGICEDNQNENAFDNYAARNAISWYTHVNGVLGRCLGGNSLLLVTGVDKTTAWGVASFSHAKKRVSMTMVPSACTQSKYWFCSVSCAAAHSGPPHNALRELDLSTDLETPNQCVFVRGIRVSVRPAIFPWASRVAVQTCSLQRLSVGDILSQSRFIPFKKVFVSSEVSASPNDAGGDHPTDAGEDYHRALAKPTVSTERVPPRSLPYHPLAVINKHLLDEHYNADVVLSHDSCWFSLIKNGEDTVPSDIELLHRVNENYDAVLSNVHGLHIIQLLLKQNNMKRADPNVQGGKYEKALQAALEAGNLNNVKLLIEKGADPNVQGGKYGTALQAASMAGNLEIVKMLFEKGADPNVPGGMYETALQAASREGNLEIVKLLVEKGADPNVQGGMYETALQAALQAGNLEIVKLLVEKRADPNVQGGKYRIAL
ncbi:multiple ankyrin repeats single kh domain [Moniliophthora roreri]|nr:multiple ankyrin repeats single kh domain [Moniliophthora roreri]